MQQALSTSVIQGLIDTLTQTGDVNFVYTYLSERGYAYADWANGVAQSETLAGASAVEYLRGTAILGIGSATCQTLTSATLQNIKQNMALEYLNVLNDYSKISGTTASDINGKDVWYIHDKVFKENGLNIDNWTLNAPLTIIKTLGGDQAVEDFWTKTRDTGGVYLNGLERNLEILVDMYSYTKSTDPTIAKMATDWLKNVPGLPFTDEFSHSLNVVKNWLSAIILDPTLKHIYELDNTLKISDALKQGGSILVDVLASTLGKLFDFLIPPAYGADINPLVATQFTSATVATPPVRRDPLVFDLDGDGLETTGISTTNPIYFDHNADGIKTATGWVNADDAFLVLDKNANGTIDDGRELFGDSTVKSNGQQATDGFDALRDLDANLDGKIDAGDAQFANLRLWRDLNQDGISQADELFTLGSQHIAAINVGSTDHSQILANGNQLADLGSFVKTDGSSGTLGEVSGNLGDINLAQNTFLSQFTDHLDTSAVATLPDMQGAGQVRNLREAATLSPVLAQLLTDFTAATTRDAQQALLEPILKAWSDTSLMATTFTGAYAGHSLTVNMQGIATGSAQYNALADKLSLLEHFNGRTFNAVPAGTTAATVNLWSTTQDFLQRSYDALKTSVYQSLVLQTRVKPLLDLISLKVDANGVSLDFTAVSAELDRRTVADPGMGAADLAEFTILTKDRLKDSGWRGWEKLIDYVNTYPMTPEILFTP